MKYICVFLSANNLVDKYTIPAIEFAKLLVKNNYSLVWGGSDKGLMKTLATTVQKAGGKIIGISMEILKKDARKNADEMVIAKDLPERKMIMLERSDAIVVMVGGMGTLDEATEILELKKHNLHTKPVIFLNTDNFYSGLRIQLQKMKNEGFLTKELDDLVHFANTPLGVIEYLNDYFLELSYSPKDLPESVAV